MINAKQRAYLRSYISTKPDMAFIGKEGIDENVIKLVKDFLFAHEIIKIKVHKTCGLDVKTLADQMALTTESEVVSVIGSKIILYKKSIKDKIKHILQD